MINQILEFQGKTKTQKLIDEIGKIYKENLNKEFPEYFQKHSTKTYCIVTALENKNEIKNLGMSVIDDLLMDNFGSWLGSILFTEATQNDIGAVEGTSGQKLDWGAWRTGNTNRCFNLSTSSTGMTIRIGSGTDAPLRSDFDIQSSFQTLISSNGAYDPVLGKVTMPSTVVSNSNNVINEAGLIARWNWEVGNAPIIVDVLFAHDLISPGVPVTIGQQINVDYQLLIN